MLSSGFRFDNSNYNFENTNTNASSHLCKKIRDINLTNMVKNDHYLKSAGTQREGDLKIAKA